LVATTNVTERQTGQWSSLTYGELLLVTVTQTSLVSIHVCARYMDKSNGHGVETEISFTLSVI